MAVNEVKKASLGMRQAGQAGQDIESSIQARILKTQMIINKTETFRILSVCFDFLIGDPFGKHFCDT